MNLTLREEALTVIELDEREVFQGIGVKGFEEICRRFYEQVPDDPLLGPMYPAEDLGGAEERLRSFLIYRFGGPSDYIEKRGHPRLRMRHAPFPIDRAARDRWMKLMSSAVEASAVDESAATQLLAFFDHMATFLMNRDG